MVFIVSPSKKTLSISRGPSGYSTTHRRQEAVGEKGTGDSARRRGQEQRSEVQGPRSELKESRSEFQEPRRNTRWHPGTFSASW